MKFRMLVLLCMALACLPGAPDVSAQESREAVILSINDVYRLKGIDEGRLGGLGRVRALRERLERQAPDLLLLHGGDFLSPSFLGRTYKGRQMVDLMNVLDGDPATATFDDRLFAVFGNHEFDDSHCFKDGPLEDLIDLSEFTWLGSNLDFAGCDRLKPIAGHPKVARTALVESGGLRIGLFGVILPERNYADIVSEPLTTACGLIAELRGAGADAVVAVTHLPWQDDLKLLGFAADGTPLPVAERVCADAPDVVIGGHDHTNMALPSAAPKLFKADADAVSAWVVKLSKDADGEIRIDAKLEMLDGKVAPDPLLDRLATLWHLRHDERYCTALCAGVAYEGRRACLKQADGGACLGEPVARTASLIETEELKNRSFETGFGNWVADRVRDAGGADVAFLNAGGIRLNEDVPAGSVIRRRHLAQMFPFVNKLAVREVTGATLWAAMEVALRKRGSGAWAHFAGMAVRVTVKDGMQTLEAMKVRRTDETVVEIGPDSEEKISVASVSFVLANGDRHGFDLCPDLDDVWACKDAIEEKPEWPATSDGDDLTAFVETYLKQDGAGTGLKLETDRRLCDPGQKDCLIDSW